MVPVAFLGAFGDAIDFIFNRQLGPGGTPVGGLEEVGQLLWTQTWISLLALGISLLIALPIGIYLGHRGTGETLAIAIGNAGRGIPELALIALMAAFIGVGVLNVTIALLILGIPPILTNAFVGVRQVDRNAVQAARGMGMGELGVLTRIEMPLAVPTIMAGVRTGAIMVALLAVAFELALAGVQRLLTPRGLRVQRLAARATA